MIRANPLTRIRRVIRLGCVQKLTMPDCWAGQAGVARQSSVASRTDVSGPAGGGDDVAGLAGPVIGWVRVAGLAGQAGVARQSSVAGRTWLFTPGRRWQIVKHAHVCPFTRSLSGEPHCHKSLLPGTCQMVDKISILRQC